MAKEGTISSSTSTNPSYAIDPDKRDLLEEKSSPYAALTSSIHTFQPAAPRHSRNSSSVNATLAATYLAPPPNKPNAVNNLLAVFGIRPKNEKTSKISSCTRREKGAILSMSELLLFIFAFITFSVVRSPSWTFAQHGVIGWTKAKCFWKFPNGQSALQYLLGSHWIFPLIWNSNVAYVAKQRGEVSENSDNCHLCYLLFTISILSTKFIAHKTVLLGILTITNGTSPRFLVTCGYCVSLSLFQDFLLKIDFYYFWDWNHSFVSTSVFTSRKSTSMNKSELKNILGE